MEESKKEIMFSVLEKNTYVTAKTEGFSLTAQIQLSSSDNVDDKDGTGATLNRTYAMVQNFKAAPDTLTGEANKTLVKLSCISSRKRI